MGYRIEYTRAGIKRKKLCKIQRKKVCVYVLVGLGLACLLWWASSNKHTLVALENMAQDVGNGMSIGDALEAFCIDILQRAEGGVE